MIFFRKMRKKELSSAIGMMEQWNDGIMGLEYWNGGFRESRRI
jgi:hypothetical protein